MFSDFLARFGASDMNKLSHILAVLNGTDDDAVVVAKAIALAQQHGAALELFLCDSERAYSLSRAFDPSGVARSRRDAVLDAKHYLECLRDTAVGADISVVVDAVCESPLYEAIVRKALACRADLVIKSLAGTSLLRPVAPDANDWQLMRACPSTLLLSRGKSWQPNPGFAVAVDISAQETTELAEEILETSRLLSNGAHGNIEVLYSEPLDTQQREHQKSLAALESLTSAAGVRGATIQVLSGPAEEVLPEFAAKQACDVLIMGALSHREGPASLVGTLTSKLVETLDCDFVLVKPVTYPSQILSTVSLLPQETDLTSATASAQLNAHSQLRRDNTLDFVSPWQLPAR
jgi:universal stress protein E